MAGYLRPEKDYSSLGIVDKCDDLCNSAYALSVLTSSTFIFADALVAAIKDDISQAEKRLEDPAFVKLKSLNFFSTSD